MLAFSLASGAIFGFVTRRWGVWAGALASASWVFQPNLFAHGHYATVDAVLVKGSLGSKMRTIVVALDALTRFGE